MVFLASLFHSAITIIIRLDAVSHDTVWWFDMGFLLAWALCWILVLQRQSMKWTKLAKVTNSKVVYDCMKDNGWRGENGPLVDYERVVEAEEELKKKENK